MSGEEGCISAWLARMDVTLTVSYSALMASTDENRLDRIEVLLHLPLRLDEYIALDLLALAEVVE